MNILVIPFCFPSEENRYSGIYVWEQCLSLRSRGHMVSVLHAHPVNYKNWFSGKLLHFEKTVNTGIPIYSIRYPAFAIGRFPLFACFCYGICLKFLWSRFLQENPKPDLLHAHFSAFAGFKALPIAQKSKIPLVVTEHGSIFLEKKVHPAFKRMLRKTVKNSDAFICVSGTLQKKIQRLCGNKTKITVIPNLVDLSFAFSKPVPKNRFLFFSAGNLIPLKKMDVLIAAFAAAFKYDQNTRLEIAGGGEQYRFLSQLIHKLGMEKQIVLLGALDRQQMRKKMIECDAFALISERETFGVAYREAMAVGRPVIAAKNGGAEEYWDDRQGILIPPNDANAAAEALIRMKNSIKSYRADAISERCLRRFSADAVTGRLESVYRKTIKK